MSPPPRAGTHITLLGSERVKAALRRAGEKGRDGIIRGLHEASLIVVGRAKENAPVDTGRLRRSINYRLRKKGPRTFLADVGTNVFYAPYIEMGTTGGTAHFAPIGATAGGRGWLRAHGYTRMGKVPLGIWVSGAPRPPKPYLLPALEASRRDVLAAVIRGVRGALREAAR